MLIVDSGNFMDNPTPAGTIKTRALVQGMERMGYAVVNVGERDIKQGYATFVDTVGRPSFELVSANIVRGDTQQPVFTPSVVVRRGSPDGRSALRVGVVGVVRFNPLFRRPGPDGSEIVIAHPKAALEREVAKLRQQEVDLIVLLAALHRDDARRLVAEVSGIDFVVGSYGGLFTTQREQEGGTWLLYAGNQGKRVGETRVFLGNGSLDQTTHMHLLTAHYPDHEPMREFVNGFGIPQETPAELPTVGAAAGHAGAAGR